MSNGIWLCGHCADIIDKDYMNYSAETLQQWRVLAERDAHQALVGSGSEVWFEPTTLVAFGFNIVTEAVWLGGSREKWRFGIKRFIRGDSAALRSFIEGAVDGGGEERFVTVESQGDGRLLTGVAEWERTTGQGDIGTIVTLPIQPRPERADPREMGTDLALADGDLAFVDGDFALVSGIDTAKQLIWRVLATPHGEWDWHPEWGSRWRRLAEEQGTDRALLGRLLLLDMARLVSIPIRMTDYVGTKLEAVEKMDAPLSFVERVESVSVLGLDWVKREISVQVTLRWAASQERWQEVLNVPLPECRPPAVPPSAVATGP
ncbi:MAG TPA: hypothetical protein VK539_07690 [Myxococcaceae bacterium]|nr:hypothetical protein [Myxococcaceae bacterium]